MCDFRNPQWRRSAVLMFLPLIIFAAVIAANTASAQTWTTAPDALFQFTRFDGEYSLQNGSVYFLGGRLPDNSTDGSIWSYDPVTGAYADTGVDMPVPISNYQIARVDDSGGNEWFMLFGGRDANGVVVNTVQGFNPVTSATIDFTATDPYPELTSPGAVEVVGNKAYSFGGFDAVVTTAGCHVFDINGADGARWTSCPDLNLSRSYIGTAVVDGVIYAFGGDTWDGAVLTAQTIGEKLDTANPTAWDDASVADLPVACDEFRAFGFDTNSGYDVAGKIIAAGCGQWPNAIADSSIYDVASNTWDTTFADLNVIRRNHAGVFIPAVDAPLSPNGNVTGTPGLWVWGGYDQTGGAVVATPEYYLVTEVTPLCVYSNDFNDTTMEWIEEKPTVTQPGDGFLHLLPLKKKAIAVADSSFAGATTGTFTFDIQFTGGVDAKNWLYTHRIDKKNQMEVLFKVEQGKVVVKDRGPNGIEDKAKADFPLAPNTPYNVVIAYNGTAYAVVINGTAVITGFSPVGALPNANIGAAAKNNELLLDNVCVN